MSALVSLSCCRPQHTAKLVLAINIIVALLAGMHWGYCGLMGKFLSFYSDPQYQMQGEYTQMMLYYNSRVAYYSITGIIQFITSVCVIIVIISDQRKGDSYGWTWAIILLLIVSFASDYAIGVGSTMDATYYFQFYKPYFDEMDAYLNGPLRNFVITLKQLVNYTIVEGIVTFTVIEPLIALTIVAFLFAIIKKDRSNQFNLSSSVSIKSPLNKEEIPSAQ